MRVTSFLLETRSSGCGPRCTQRREDYESHAKGLFGHVPGRVSFKLSVLTTLIFMAGTSFLCWVRFSVGIRCCDTNLTRGSVIMIVQSRRAIHTKGILNRPVDQGEAPTALAQRRQRWRGQPHLANGS